MAVRDEERYLRSDELLFTVKGIASMHCSANVGEEGDVAIFWSFAPVRPPCLLTRSAT